MMLITTDHKYCINLISEYLVNIKLNKFLQKCTIKVYHLAQYKSLLLVCKGVSDCI